MRAMRQHDTTILIDCAWGSAQTEGVDAQLAPDAHARTRGPQQPGTTWAVPDAAASSCDTLQPGDALIDSATGSLPWWRNARSCASAAVSASASATSVYISQGMQSPSLIQNLSGFRVTARRTFLLEGWEAAVLRAHQLRGDTARVRVADAEMAERAWFAGRAAVSAARPRDSDLPLFSPRRRTGSAHGVPASRPRQTRLRYHCPDSAQIMGA
jgi:hypothetical protein